MILGGELVGEWSMLEREVRLLRSFREDNSLCIVPLLIGRLPQQKHGAHVFSLIFTRNIHGGSNLGDVCIGVWRMWMHKAEESKGTRRMKLILLASDTYVIHIRC